MTEQTEQEKSIIWVIAMVVLLIAVFGWAFAAAGYAHSEQGWRSGGVQGAEQRRSISRGARRALFDFVANAFAQIPNMPAVIGFTIKRRLWLAMTVVVLEIVALISGAGLKALEKRLSSPPRRRKK